jgi:hypothetical protein
MTTMTITTAGECSGMRADEVLEKLAPMGRAVAGVGVEQDWNAGTTTCRFEDGTAVVVDGRDVRVIDAQ